MSFLPAPSVDPKSKDVAKFIGIIRETTKSRRPQDSLRIVTSLFHALALFAVHKFGHLETLAILKTIKEAVEETDVVGKINPFS